MNRVTIKYDLDNKHESVAFERAIRSTDLALILWEILKNRKTAVTNNQVGHANVNSPLGQDAWNNSLMPQMYSLVNTLASKMKRFMNCYGSMKLI